MLFKIGFFLLAIGIAIPIFSYANFVIWDKRTKNALQEYREKKAKGMPLTGEMKNAYLEWCIVYTCGLLAFWGPSSFRVEPNNLIWCPPG